MSYELDQERRYGRAKEKKIWALEADLDKRKDLEARNAALLDALEKVVGSCAKTEHFFVTVKEARALVDKEKALACPETPPEPR